MLKNLMLKSLVSVLVWSLTFAAYAMADAPKPVNVPAGDLVQGLESLAKQADVEFVYQAAQLKGLRTRGVSGNFTAHEAVTKLLEGTKARLSTDPATGAMLISPPTQGGVDPPSSSPASIPAATGNDAKEGKKSPGARSLLAQVDQGSAQSDSSVEEQGTQTSKKKAVSLEEVIVTGSRIPRSASEGAQEVKTYTSVDIEQSGQNSIGSFINTLPAVSVSVTQAGLQTTVGASTVQLHGLPIGSTLVLIDGRRIETSGAQESTNFFDLNNLPLAVVERIEVISEGSSAIYGSDAIAGVVNIILKKDFDGVEVSGKYGWASGTHDWNTAMAWGKRWDRGSFSIVGTYDTQTELEGFGRSISGNNNYTAYGGIDARTYDCDPGNVFFPNGYSFNGQPPVQYAAVPAGFAGPPTTQEFAGTAGTLNKCSNNGYRPYIPAMKRFGALGQGSYQLTSSVQLFVELMYSHYEEFDALGPPELFGEPIFQSFTVAANNPYNPFGQTVGVSGLIDTLGRSSAPNTTEFVRPLVGARGDFLDSWHWELAVWESYDRTSYLETNLLNGTAAQAAFNSTDPASALNPFVAGAYGSPQLLQSLMQDYKADYWGRNEAANGFIRGPILQLPSGPITAVVGAEYDRDMLASNVIESPYGDQGRTNWYRNSHAVFGEARVPLLANHSNPSVGDTLAISVAGRYDSYNDFGSKTTPQLGAEWRPLDSLLLRSTYGKAFIAPSLSALNFPVQSFQGSVIDPRSGTRVPVTVFYGGNPDLHPETGQSRTFGFVYSSRELPGLELAVTQWGVDMSDNIQQLSAQTIVNNESVFPSNVVRNSAGIITSVSSQDVNFGAINVRGIDFRAAYDLQTRLGDFSPSITATDTYHYTGALRPGVPPTDRSSIANDDADWAPRWKGTIAVGWKNGPYSAKVDGRYVGRYQDYDSTREIGNFWLCDANFRYSIGSSLAPANQWLKGAYVEVGGVNIFNTLPQYSNYGFGNYGFDPAQSDIRGRFLYGQMGVKW